MISRFAQIIPSCDEEDLLKLSNKSKNEEFTPPDKGTSPRLPNHRSIQRSVHILKDSFKMNPISSLNESDEKSRKPFTIQLLLEREKTKYFG